MHIEEIRYVTTLEGGKPLDPQFNDTIHTDTSNIVIPRRGELVAGWRDYKGTPVFRVEEVLYVAGDHVVMIMLSFVKYSVII